jgi:hypothetical protein
MATQNGNGNQESTQEAPEFLPPQGRVAGVPYDLRRPTVARAKARYWNGGDPHVFTPKTYGAGWDINFFWLAHPVRFMKRSRVSV